LSLSVSNTKIFEEGRLQRAGLRKHREESESMSKQILAPMPGKVVDILVQVGEDILEYQEVLILEAMKMENAIPSPEPGKVREIKVKKDDTVAAQQVLMVLE
jgi:biotin carboxyl carrier protein